MGRMQAKRGQRPGGHVLHLHTRSQFVKFAPAEEDDFPYLEFTMDPLRYYLFTAMSLLAFSGISIKNCLGAVATEKREELDAFWCTPAYVFSAYTI